MNTEPRVDDTHLQPPLELGRIIYFDSESHTLFGWLHQPERIGTLGLVICKPFGYEAICSHRALRVMAERSAAAGIPTLRFDYRGTGDSDDIDLAADQVTAWTADVRAAVRELRQRTGVTRVCVLGVRLGAMLATLAARSGEIDALILIAPTVSGRRYLREFKTTRLASALRYEGAEGAAEPRAEPGSMEVAGFSISAATVASLAAVDLGRMTQPPAARMLFLDALGFAAAAGWADLLQASNVCIEYQSLSGPMEMVMTAPQFGMNGGAVVDSALVWLGGLTEVPPRAPRHTGSCDDEPSEFLQSQGGGPVERPVFIAGSAMIFGILTQPLAGEGRRRAVVLLNAAADYHIGPGRMYVSLARGWAKHGYFVLRIDLAGLGDSATQAGQSDDVVFTSAALEDIAAVIQFLKVHHGVRDVTLAGLCSGAYHALRAAMEQLPVDRILMVNPLNFFWDKDMQHSELKLAEVVRVPIRYRERLFSFRHWSLLLRGRVSLWRIFWIYVQRGLLALESTLRDLLRTLHLHLPRDLGWELERIAERGVSMVFVFAKGEPGINLLKLQAGSALKRLGTRCRIHIIDSGDHIFGRSGPRSILESILSEELFAPASVVYAPPQSHLQQG